jgi:TonB family protein
MTATTLTDRKRTERTRTVRAVILSVILHLLFILGFAVMLSMEPRMELLPEEEDTVEITFVDPPPEPAPAEQTPYLSTSEAQRSETAPENPVFESDKDTRAAAEVPAEGDMPLPTQQGEESPATEFEDRAYTPGQEPRPAAPPVPESPPAQPAPPTEEQPDDRTAEQIASQPEINPRPPASEIALLQPVRPRTTPRPTPPEETARPETGLPPRPPTPEGFQPQTRVTRLKGNISNRGRSAADAAATPLGRYKKQVSDAIGSRWYYYVNDAIGLLAIGTVELRFTVTPEGKVEKVQVLRNSSNESFASTSVRAVVDAEIPPIPEDILPMLPGGKIEVDFSFTILTN